MAFHSTVEYETRRAKNIQEERDMRNILSAIYQSQNLQPIYNSEENAPLDVEDKQAWVVDMEKRGFDVKLNTQDNHTMIIDEKAFTSQPQAYSTQKTFAFEISTQNNKNAQGWLFKQDAVNTHYALIYPEKNIDTHVIEKMEILIIKKEAVLQELEKYNLTDIQKTENFLFKDGSLLENKMNPSKYAIESPEYRKDGKIQKKIDDNMKLVASLQLAEQPVNVVINRAWLRQHSDIILDIPNVQQVVNKYQQQQTEKPLSDLPQQKEQPSTIRGILFHKQAQEAFAKAAKKIPKLRNVQLPPFIETQSLNTELGIKTSLHVSGYALHGNTVVLQAMANKELYDKPLCIICGKSEKNLNPNSLSFKELPQKQTFMLHGEICDINVKEKTITKKELQTVKEELACEVDDR